MEFAQAFLCGKPHDTDFEPPIHYRSAKTGGLGRKYNGGRNRWTPEENRILVENYPISGVEGCVLLLPNRSPQAISVQACKKRVTSSYNSGAIRAPWSVLENEIVAKHDSPQLAVAELARAGFTRSYAAVNQRISQYSKKHGNR